jgi:hypothetical protein
MDAKKIIKNNLIPYLLIKIDHLEKIVNQTAVWLYLLKKRKMKLEMKLVFKDIKKIKNKNKKNIVYTKYIHHHINIIYIYYILYLPYLPDLPYLPQADRASQSRMVRIKK